jgi:hypothetical protein
MSNDDTIAAANDVPEHRTDIARRIFAYWKEATKKRRSQLDEKRMKSICRRLADGYAEEDLKLAIFGCVTSKWHQGDNDRQRVYDSIELIFRDADKVDQFIDMGEKEKRKREALKIIQKQNDEARLAASVRGEGYEKARKAILSIVKKDAA